MSAGEEHPVPSGPAPRPPRVARSHDGGWGRRVVRRNRPLTVLSVLVAGLLVVAAAAVGVGLLDETDEEPAALCGSGTPVSVVVDPTLADTVRHVVEDAEGTLLSTGVCADVTVLAEDPALTAAALADGSPTVPQVWVPDSSVWLGRAVSGSGDGTVQLTVLGSLVSSPVVLATSREVVDEAGWAVTGPTWSQAFSSGRGIALPGLAGSAVGLQSLVALRASVPDPEQARAALTAAAVTVERGRVPDTGAAMRLALEAGAEAPLVPTTEQQVFRANRGSARTDLVGLQPAGAVTSLDYPLVRVDRVQDDADVDAAAVEGVLRLLESAGRDQALVDGFREPLTAAARPSGPPSAPPPSGTSSAAASDVAPDAASDPASADPGPPSQVSPATEPVLVVPVPSAEDVDTLLAQLEELSRPSRVLAVFDASASMRGVTGSGDTRAQIAQDAAKGSLALFPDTAAIGLWFFAVGMGPDGEDHVEVVPLRALDPETADVDQRAALAAGIDTLPERLTPGGTGLYDTTLAAVRALREAHDPDASNSVVLVTDGREQDTGGISQTALVETLRAEADPDRPVRVIAIGLSDDVDAEELGVIAEATGGAAYLAERPEDFQTVLFDALRRR